MCILGQTVKCDKSTHKFNTLKWINVTYERKVLTNELRILRLVLSALKNSHVNKSRTQVWLSWENRIKMNKNTFAHVEICSKFVVHIIVSSINVHLSTSHRKHMKITKTLSLSLTLSICHSLTLSFPLYYHTISIAHTYPMMI